MLRTERQTTTSNRAAMQKVLHTLQTQNATLVEPLTAPISASNNVDLLGRTGCKLVITLQNAACSDYVTSRISRHMTDVIYRSECFRRRRGVQADRGMYI